MKTLKEKFGELSARIKASGQPARVWFPQYTPASLLNAENWWEALAVCEYALDTKEDEKLIEDFFELIFSAFDCNVEVDLNAEEYEFWWEPARRSMPPSSRSSRTTTNSLMCRTTSRTTMTMLTDKVSAATTAPWRRRWLGRKRRHTRLQGLSKPRTTTRTCSSSTIPTTSEAPASSPTLKAR